MQWSCCARHSRVLARSCGSPPSWPQWLGVTAQREMEQAVRDAVANGRLKGGEKLPAKAVVTLGGANLRFEIDGDIELA
jgi:hypothetical protein